MKIPIIALITDFGEDDFFVASLKGAILKINPSARIVDITHRIRSFDLKSASFILYSSCTYFPEKTIFVVVIDPGVGSSRQILLVETKNYFFIAPDNGVLTLTLEEEDVLQIRSVENEKYFLPQKGHTFEGRDKMAPVAASLSKGVPCEEFGPELKEYKRIDIKKPVMEEDEIFGHVLYTDKFGNLITNIPARMVNKLREKYVKEGLGLIVKGVEILQFKESYSSVKEGELLFLVGSLGTIEIAAREASAAARIKATQGDSVKIYIREDQ